MRSILSSSWSIRWVLPRARYGTVIDAIKGSQVTAMIRCINLGDNRVLST